MIAIGGLVATYGWNLRSDQTQRDAIIKAIATPSVEFVMFPRFHHVALDGALGSGRFTSKGDRQLLARVTELREKLVSLNERLNFAEGRMSDRPEEIEVFRTKLSNGKTLNQTRELIRTFGSFLVDQGFVDSKYEPYEVPKGA
jgi:hypothetical protein